MRGFLILRCTNYLSGKQFPVILKDFSPHVKETGFLKTNQLHFLFLVRFPWENYPDLHCCYLPTFMMLLFQLLQKLITSSQFRVKFWDLNQSAPFFDCVGIVGTFHHAFGARHRFSRGTNYFTLKSMLNLQTTLTSTFRILIVKYDFGI